MPKPMQDRNFCGIGMRKFLEIDYCATISSVSPLRQKAQHTIGANVLNEQTGTSRKYIL